jgi:pyrroline-5-carboxylate reductase
MAILGGGNLGQALARGWVRGGVVDVADLVVTRRRLTALASLVEEGIQVGDDNRKAVREADIIVLAVQPQQIEALMAEIRDELDPTRHLLVSVISGVTISRLRELAGSPSFPVARAMPNTAVSIGESMTCISAPEGVESGAARVAALFEGVGRTLMIREEMMIPATALCACGVAFFLRAVRAASQGGIEIGFHPEEALFLAAQTAKGAAALLQQRGSHPESEIDRVTTPRGCTIAGLNEMEHQGFSSAMIKGIIGSARSAETLYRTD